VSLAVSSLELMVGQRDRERPVYNLKEAMLAKCYIEVLGLDKQSEAAQRLIKWKQPVDGLVRSSSIGVIYVSLSCLYI